MTAEMTTVIGQFSIINGRWHNDAPNQVAVREPKSADGPGKGKGDLFVLAEVRGQAGARETIERQLTETFRDAYYLARGSITASLRRAVQTAGDLLYDRNYAVSVEERVIGGVVALVRQHEDVFVAQIGPTACYAVLDDLVRRYPAQSAWLDEAFGPERAEDEPVLGISAVVEPKLNHLRVSPEDVLVLADSGLASQLPLEDVANAVDGSNVKTALKNLGSVAQANDCSAMVLAMVEQPQPTLGPLKMNAPSSLSKLLRREGGQPAVADPSMAAVAPEPEPALETVGTASSQSAGPEPSRGSDPLAGKMTSRQMVPGRHRSPTAKHPPAAAAIQTSGKQNSAESVAVEEEDYEEGVNVLASTVPEATFNTHMRGSRHTDTPSGVAQALRKIGTGILMAIVFVGNGIRALFGRVTPKTGQYTSRQAGMQAHRHQTPFISWKLLRNIAIAIPLLVAVIVGVSYLQKGRMLEAEYQELVTTAQNKFEQAQSVDPAAAFSLMAESNNLLTQAEQLKPDQPEVAELRTQMAEKADELGEVQRLYYLPQLRQYTDPGTNLKGITVQGVEVYVLDAGNDRVYHHRLDDLGESLLPDDDTLLLVSPGQAVDEISTAELLDIAWMPAGGNRQTSDLLILNSTGLLEYHPNWGLTTAALAGGEALVLPAAVSSYFGNLYVLDPKANTLLRYLPMADGYSAPPESYFPVDKPVDLTNAVDLAIDGAIYVLFSDGRIEKYLSGEPTDFNLSGLDRPLNNPVSIFTAPNEELQYVYVADAGNQRILQLNKDGSFVRQFKPRPDEAVSFANLQDIYVDEIGGRLYILDSNNLYVGNIPNE
jgi:hypothetical protein